MKLKWIHSDVTIQSHQEPQWSLSDDETYFIFKWSSDIAFLSFIHFIFKCLINDMQNQNLF